MMTPQAPISSSTPMMQPNSKMSTETAYSRRTREARATLLPVLCAFLEAVSRVFRARLLRPIRDRAIRRLAKAFRAQGAALVRALDSIKGQFPIQEAAPKPPNIDAPFDRAAKQTSLPFVEAIDDLASAALEVGALASLKDLGMAAAFNLDNPRAVRYLENYGAKLVKGINETTREYIRTVVTQGVEQGWSYGKIAAAITERYKEFAVGRPQQHIDSRAHLIAVQEAGQAYSEATMIVGLDLEDIGIEMVKSQLTVGDLRVSEECRANAAQGWIPIRQEFQSGHQRPLIHVACVLGQTRVSADSVFAVSDRLYDGDLIVLKTASGKQLSCTPNHPILTPRGWIAAGRLDIGGEVVSSSLHEWSVIGDVDHNDAPATIEQVAYAFGQAGKVLSSEVEVSPEDFHGDGFGGQIAVIRSNSFLRDTRNATIRQHLAKQDFSGPDDRQASFSCQSIAATLFERCFSTAIGFMRSLGVSPMVFATAGGHHIGIGFQLPASSDSMFQQDSRDGTTATTKRIRQGVFRLSGTVLLDDLILGKSEALLEHGLRESTFQDDSRSSEVLADGTRGGTVLHRDIDARIAGTVFADKVIQKSIIRAFSHVYNLQTEAGYYAANGIITHNCRCSLLTRAKGATE